MIVPETTRKPALIPGLRRTEAPCRSQRLLRQLGGHPFAHGKADDLPARENIVLREAPAGCLHGPWFAVPDAMVETAVYMIEQKDHT